jgi:Cu2+-exporting ATPase
MVARDPQKTVDSKRSQNAKELSALSTITPTPSSTKPVNAESIRYELLHVVPGRVRLKIEALRHEADFAQRFRALLMAQAGVQRVRVNDWCASAIIEYCPEKCTVGSILDRLDQGGVWSVEPYVEPCASTEKSQSKLVKWLTKFIETIERLAPAIVQLSVAGAAFVAALLEMPLAVTNTLVAASVAPIIARALDTAVEERRVGVDALDGIAAVLMLASGKTVAAGFMTMLIGLGEFIRELTAQRCKKIIADLLGLAGRSAWIVRGKNRICVPAEQVCIADVVVVYPGDMIPVDGVVISGEAEVNQSSLTGESSAVEVGPGSNVFAATVVLEGKIYLRCEATGRNTRAGRVIEMVQSAPIHETKVQNYAALMADKLVMPVLLGAVGCLAFTQNVQRAMSIVIFDFATGVRIAAPTAILASMQRAGHHGILIKSGGALEKLATVDAILFDKTGTLTAGRPHVTDVIALNQVPKERMLELAAAVEQRLQHPAARAIVHYAGHHNLNVLDRTDSEHMRGLGVRAQVDGEDVMVGSRRMMESESIDMRPAQSAEAETLRRGQSLAYVAINGELAGLIAYADQLRPEAARVIETLRKQGVKEIVMATGDNEAPARAMAHASGITNVLSGAFPEQKAELVMKLKERGFTVGVIGDGINDSPALAHADVAISLHGGTDVAREHADVILTDDDLRRLPEAIDIARGAMGLVKQNLTFIAVPNGVGLGLAACGLIGPAGATLLNNGSAILAAINSLRPLYSDQWVHADQERAR